jgi:hypothetical protein
MPSLISVIAPELRRINSQSKKRKIQPGRVFWVNEAQGMVEFLNR